MSRQMTRRAALATAALVASAGRTAFAQATPVTVRVATSPNDDLSALLWAQQSGMLRDVGIALTIGKMNNGSFVAAALAGGAADLGKISSIPIITAHVHGIPFRIVYPNKLNIVGQTDTAALLVLTGASYHTARDLKDTLIAVAALDDSTWIGARAWIDANGGDSTASKYIELPFSAMNAALEQNRIQVASIGQPYITSGINSGKERQLADVMTAIGPRVLQSAWCATADYAAKNRDVVAKLAHVLAESAKYCNSHQSEIIPITAAFTDLDPAMLATMKTVYSTSPDPREMQPWVDMTAKYKVIPERFDAKDLYA